MRLSVFSLCTLLAVTACGRAHDSNGALSAADRVVVAPHVSVVDSARPIEVELARFRTEAGGRAVTELDSRARTRDQLVDHFVRALERNDTAALRALVIDAAEFAWLYYPYTVYTHPPYQQAPGLVWMLTVQNSEKGIGRLLQRFGGGPLAVTGYRCARTEPQDLNLLHQECGVLLAGDTVPRPLFGTIIERNGRFKFVSYANGL